MLKQRAGSKEQGMSVVRASAVFAALTSTLLLAGCRQDMHDQPKIYPQRGNTLFADGRSARLQVADTVSRDQLHADEYFFSGFQGGKEGDGLPVALTPALMERGQERYNIYCTPCHSRVGNGDGMIVQRGYRPAGNFHTDRLRSAPLGHFFNVITNGYGAMPEYASQVTPEDRWAIVAYIRALQLSQNAKQTDVASGAHPEDLHKIATEAGMPTGFADSWGLPGTAIYGTPNGEDNGIPGQGTGSGAPAGSGANKAHYGQAATGNGGNRNSNGQGTPAAPSADAPGRIAGEHPQQ